MAKNKVKVLSIDEKLIGKMNSEIRDLIILNTKDNNEYYGALDAHMQIMENGSNDAKYILENDPEALPTYITDRRNLLTTTFRSRVSEEITTLSSCIFTTICNAVSSLNEPDDNLESLYYHLQVDRIIEILLYAFDPNPRVYMPCDDAACMNSYDLTVINNNIPERCMTLNSYLKATLSDYILFKYPTDLKAQSELRNYIYGVIEAITFTTQTSLVALYCEIKDYVESTIYPLGYPNIVLEQEE